MEPDRKYPVGIQTFSRLREEGYLYIDKTDLDTLVEAIKETSGK